MPIASIATFAACRMMPTGGKPLAASRDFQPGCGATPMCWLSSNGCARATTACGIPPGKSAFTASISTVFTHRSMPWSVFSTASTRPPLDGRATTTRVSTISTATANAMPMQRRSEPRSPAKTKCWRSCLSSSAVRRRASRAERTATSASRRCKTRGWSKTPRNIIERCSAGACRRGTCVTGTCSIR